MTRTAAHGLSPTVFVYDKLVFVISQMPRERDIESERERREEKRREEKRREEKRREEPRGKYHCGYGTRPFCNTQES